MRLGGSLGNAEHRRNLGVTIPFHIIEHEDGAGTRREVRHGCLEVECRSRFGTKCGCAVEQRHIGEIGSDRHAEATAAIVSCAIEHGVDGDPMQPGRKGALATIAAQSLPDPDEDILDQFGGQHRIGTEPKAQRENPPYVFIVERRECQVVTALSGQDSRIDRNLNEAGRKRDLERGVEHPFQTPPDGNEFTLLGPPRGGPVTRSGIMSVFDELEEKARELAAKAKAALENPDEFISKTRERMEEAVNEAKEDVEEFASDAREEFKGIRERMADLFDCEPKATAEGAPGEPAAAEPTPPPSADPTTPPESEPVPPPSDPNQPG